MFSHWKSDFILPTGSPAGVGAEAEGGESFVCGPDPAVLGPQGVLASVLLLAPTGSHGRSCRMRSVLS